MRSASTSARRLLDYAPWIVAAAAAAIFLNMVRSATVDYQANMDLEENRARVVEGSVSWFAHQAETEMLRLTVLTRDALGDLTSSTGPPPEDWARGADHAGPAILPGAVALQYEIVWSRVELLFTDMFLERVAQIDDAASHLRGLGALRATFDALDDRLAGVPGAASPRHQSEALTQVEKAARIWVEPVRRLSREIYDGELVLRPELFRALRDLREKQRRQQILFATLVLVSGLASALGLRWCVRLARRLMETRERFDAAFDGAALAIAFFDHHGRLMQRNDEFDLWHREGDLHWRLGDTARDHFDRLAAQGRLPPDSIPAVWAETEAAPYAVQSGRRLKVLPDGRKLLIDSGRETEGGHVITVADVTDLVAARDRAQALSAERSEMLAVIGHELRTPISALVGALDLAADAARTMERQARRRDAPRREVPAPAPRGEPPGSKPDGSSPGRSDGSTDGAFDGSVEGAPRTDPAALAQLGRHVSNARQAAEVVAAMSEDVFEFASVSGGAAPCRMADFNLHELFDALAVAAGPRAEARGLGFAARIDGLRGAYVHGDRVRLRQVVENLLTNALKFTSEGSITLRAELSRDPQDPDPGRRRLRVAVEDTGPGVPPEARALIFEPFRQHWQGPRRRKGAGPASAGDERPAPDGRPAPAAARGLGAGLAAPLHAARDKGARRRPMPRGLGLGLAICRRILTAMGGEIGMRPGESGGSIFWLEAPLRLAPRPTERPRSAGFASLEGALEGEGRRSVLLVEDDPLLAEVTLAQLRRAGFEAVHAASVAEATAIGVARVFDLVLLDLQLPDGTGADVARALRAGPDGPDRNRGRGRPERGDMRSSLIVALTAYADEEVVAEVRALGIDHILNKPLSAERMAGILRAEAARAGPFARSASQTESPRPSDRPPDHHPPDHRPSDGTAPGEAPSPNASAPRETLP